MSKRQNLAAALHDAGAKPALVQLASVGAPEPSAPDSSRLPSRAPSRDGQRAVTLYVKPEAHKQLRLLGVEQGASVQELMTEALNDLFLKHKKPPIS
jgi:hypothetical protein